MAHQTHSTFVHHLPQRHQVLIALVLYARKVVLQIRLQFPLLLADVWEVDEEARAHVALHLFHLRLRGRLESAHQQVAVLEQPATPDLFWAAGGDSPGEKVPQSFLKVSVHALPLHCRVEGLGHGSLRTAVEEQQRVQSDLE